MHQIRKAKHAIIIGMTFFLLHSVSSSVEAEDSATNIICTNSVLADFTTNILTENVSIEYIMPAGVCPAHFDTCPSDVALIAQADIIISLGWEPWLTDLLESSGNTDYLEIKCMGLGEWSYPENAKKIVEKIRDELMVIFPDLNHTIQTNAGSYLMQINETTQVLRTMIQTNGFEQKQVICMQWHQEFVDMLGLNVTYAYGPPERLSTQDMLNVSNAAQTEEIYVIIDNLQSGTDFGARIASESGANHVIFSNFPQAIPGADTYLETITYNTDQLVNGMKTYTYRQGEIAQLESTVSSLELQRNIALTGLSILALLGCVLFILYKRK